MTAELETFRAETRAWLQANCPPEMRTPMRASVVLYFFGAQ